jgi:uncharacterized protein (DUF1800 family)
MLDPAAAAIAANRFGLGARPGELAAIGGDGRDWLRAQLKGSPPVLADAQLRPSAEILVQGQHLRREIEEAKKSARADAGDAAMADLMKVGQYLKPIYVSEATARLAQAVATERAFVERLTQFWANHFAVSIDKQLLAGLAGSFEREAIRPHVLGRFSDMLLAVETHPAMLLYLDNHLSVGPDSPAAQRLERRQTQRKIGINENLAREILELHTLGVGAGYTQADVTSFAEVITGWSIGDDRGRFAGGTPGVFLFRAEFHEPGTKVVLNTRYPDTGFDQGVAVLRDIARQPATAHFIATKLVRHFVADDPPPQVVSRVAGAFTASEGDLPTVYRALIDAHDSWAAPLAKFKTPSDYIVSTFRGLSLPVEAGKGGVAAFELLGQRTWSPGSPAGWPDKSADWDGSSALIKRIQWADAVGARLGSKRDAAQLAPQLLGANLSDATRTAVARAASGAQAVTLVLAAPEFMRR